MQTCPRCGEPGWWTAPYIYRRDEGWFAHADATLDGDHRPGPFERPWPIGAPGA